MSFLRSQLPLDALMGQAQLLGQMQQLAFREPTMTPGTGAGSFHAQLLQQVMGDCDRSSLTMNEPAGEALPLSPSWHRSAYLGHQGLGEKPAIRHAASRDVPLAQTGHAHHAAPHSPRSTQARPIPPPTAVAEPATQKPREVTVVHPPSAADGFLEKLAGVARSTAEVLGLSPHLLLAQAALETGWGRKAIKDAAGQESFNLFGIKASKHWTGKTVEVTTTEYSHGVPQKKVESFRAYGSYAESFSDYARLIKNRYGEAMAHGATAEGFGRALQANGYATDPKYAQKIARVAQSVAYRMARRSSSPGYMA